MNDMLDNNLIDIKENYIYHLDNELLSILLMDHSSSQNIIWATDNYASRGYGYQSHDQITVQAITGYNGNIIKPRVEKSSKEQFERIKKKAEVFTPSWICNKQNNLVDNAWFESENVFNSEEGQSWVETAERIKFPTTSGKKWEDYIEDTRLEIACGEAPYLVSRYDTVTGEVISISRRIGLLDRKLRVVSENVDLEPEWYSWAKIAFQSTYGFEWQGDNVLLARENLLFTFVDYYQNKFGSFPEKAYLREISTIISWNIWQMDGLKFVIPDSCVEVDDGQMGLFDDETEKHPCEGCVKNDPLRHTGVYCKIKDWETNKTVKFVSLLRNGVEK